MIKSITNILVIFFIFQQLQSRMYQIYKMDLTHFAIKLFIPYVLFQKISYIYSLSKKEWICSLFKEWISEKSEIRVNLEWTFVLIHSFWSDHRDHSGIPSDPWGHSKMSE